MENQKVSLCSSSNEALNELVENKVIQLDAGFQRQVMANSIDGNVSVDPSIFTKILPEQIHNIVPESESNKFTDNGIKIAGDWTDERFLVAEVQSARESLERYGFGDGFNGLTTPQPKVSTIERGQAHFAVCKKVNMTEQEKWARFNVNLENEVNRGVDDSFAYTEDLVFFNGVNTGNSLSPIYGLLNDPNNFPTETATVAWDNPTKTAQDILTDLSNFSSAMKSNIMAGGGSTMQQLLDKPGAYIKVMVKSQIQAVLAAKFGMVGTMQGAVPFNAMLKNSNVFYGKLDSVNFMESLILANSSTVDMVIQIITPEHNALTNKKLASTLRRYMPVSVQGNSMKQIQFNGLGGRLNGYPALTLFVGSLLS